MAYRDVSESLRAYRDRVANDLEDARRSAREATALVQKVNILEKELAETEGLLAKMGGKRNVLPLLDNVSVAAPCKASWDQMVGDEHVRFCGQCETNVYNLSSLPREEAEALLAAKEGSMCIRLFRRADGTVLTSDCPVGVTRRRRRRAAIAAVGGGLMAAAAALGMERSVATMGSPVPDLGREFPATMGSAAVLQGDVAPVAAPPATETLGQRPVGSGPVPSPAPPTLGHVTMGRRAK